MRSEPPHLPAPPVLCDRLSKTFHTLCLCRLNPASALRPLRLLSFLAASIANCISPDTRCRCVASIALTAGGATSESAASTYESSVAVAFGRCGCCGRACGEGGEGEGGGGLCCGSMEWRSESSTMLSEMCCSEDEERCSGEGGLLRWWIS